MSWDYAERPYVQRDGTIIQRYICDTETDRDGLDVPAGSIAFCRDTDEYHVRKTNGQWATAHSHPFAAGSHDHDADYSAIDHTHGGGGGEAFPVGSVFISVVSTNPATLLGYGTWSAFGAGRVLVGLDSGDTDFDTVEETGGAKTVTLTEQQIPAHTHVQNAHTHNFLPRTATTGSVSSIVTGTLDTSSTIGGANQPHVQNATATNQNTGGGTAHSSVQPYVVAYFWKRVS